MPEIKHPDRLVRDLQRLIPYLKTKDAIALKNFMRFDWEPNGGDND